MQQILPYLCSHMILDKKCIKIIYSRAIIIHVQKYLCYNRNTKNFEEAYIVLILYIFIHSLQLLYQLIKTKFVVVHLHTIKCYERMFKLKFIFIPYKW